jgi:2'-5' RNA ligase
MMPQVAIRTFIAVEIPESIKSRIERLQETLREIGGKVSWTTPSNIHLTLKFLGAVEESRIERVRKAVEDAARGIGPFEVQIGGTGCFPSPRSPRVLWVGLPAVPEPLTQLHSKIETELDGAGFALEKRRFSPHLTIGRIRAQHNATAVAEAFITSGFEVERFEAKQVVVMRSDLKPTGSIYTRQAIIKLD